MKKVITYGTYDLLHYGHIKLLERAKELGDYLIVGVTSDDFDKKRGKINVQQTLIERVKAVKETGLADEIIIEEYEGQKIEDICKYGIDVFTVGSDWKGKFDYLKEYCDVVYLPRTKGVSSSDLRSEKRQIKFGLLGECINIEKIARESNLVNGIELTGICIESIDECNNEIFENVFQTTNYDELLEKVDALYIISNPEKHFEQIELALKNKKHVLCESPIVLKKEQADYLYNIASKNKCILMESLKTAYSTAYLRMILLLKMGIIGKIVSIDSTCTSLKEITNNILFNKWNSICAWGTVAMLPIFQILGTNYKNKNIISLCSDENKNFDLFTKVNFTYENAVASIKVGKGVKSEGELIVTGTKGYIYVPAPWWKTDYFEVRFENSNENKRYFYQLEGEGIRNELVSFVRSINEKNCAIANISKDVSMAIIDVIEDFYDKQNFIELK